jgi:class 3 adenylate cyclase/esterase/lipase
MIAPEHLPETRFAKSGEVNIAYQVMGEGPVDLVWVPGLCTHVELNHEIPGYTDFMRRLAGFSRLALFDKRGQGLSDRVAGAPTLEERSDDVRAVMDAIGMKRVALVGVSEGTMMAAYFAATYPERVSHLVLAAGLAKQVSSDDYPYGPSPELFRKFAEHWTSGMIIKSFIPSLAGDPAFAALAAKYERQSCSPGNFRALAEMNIKLDTRAILPQIRVPTLVLHRTNDRVVQIEQGRYYAEHIRGAKFIAYPEGEDHFFMTRDGDAFCADIEQFVTGARHEASQASERVLATVLFTDIVDSTAQASRLGDAAWRKTLDEHDHIVRRLIEHHRGRLVKTTGDGVLATFDGPGRAIHCALAMEPALARLNLSVRAGLHTGEVETRGDDIGGIAVHTASRVMSSAGAGEVLVSRVVADLVAGSNIHFSDRGEAQLKGIPGTWRLLAASV